MGPRQKPHGERLLYDSHHIKAGSCNLRARQRSQTVLVFSSGLLSGKEKLLWKFKNCQISGFHTLGYVAVLSLICIPPFMKSEYEVDYERRQRVRLWKFTAVNVRVINELKESTPTRPTWCSNTNNKKKKRCKAALACKILLQHMIPWDESVLILIH